MSESGGRSARLTLPTLAWLPFVVPLCFVFATWSGAQVELAWLLRPIAVTIAIVAVVTVLARALFGRVLGTAVAVIVTAGLTTADLRIAALSLLFSALLVVAVRISAQDRLTLIRRVLDGYRVVAAVLVVVIVAGSILNGSLPAAVASWQQDLALAAPADPADASLPDIWVILLDGYPGDDALAALDPAYDADAFPSALASLGFDVQRHSRTSYPLTRLVLPSMFNGQHLQELVATDAETSDLDVLTRRLRSTLEGSTALQALGEAGYERIAISSGWAEVGPRRVDRLIEPPQLTEFEVTLIRQSSLGGILGILSPDIHSQQIRDRIETTFRDATAIALEPHPGPRFVFVHLPAPHPPVVFGSSGSPVNGTSAAAIDTATAPALPRDQRLSLQVGELEYIDEQFLDLARTIMDRSARPAAVVVFSDHGTDIDWDPNHPLAAGINERSSNLLGVLAPGHDGVYPPGTTTVNVLTRLLRAYGIADLPAQPDTTWFYRSPANILDLVQVDPTTGATR